MPLEYFKEWNSNDTNLLRENFPATTDMSWCGEFQPKTRPASTEADGISALKICANGHGNKLNNDECWICGSKTWLKR
jgi:hypothetical protein